MTVCNAGRPRLKDRRRRVRRIYSLLQDASALTRVKARRCDRSKPFTCIAAVAILCVNSDPGKYRAKAIRQAGGVVTSLWKRRETRLMEDSVSGGRCERMCVSTSVHCQSINNVWTCPGIPLGNSSKHVFRACPFDAGTTWNIILSDGASALSFIFALSYSSTRLPGELSCEESPLLLIRPALCRRPRDVSLEDRGRTSSSADSELGNSRTAFCEEMPSDACCW